jgi:Zn-dependent M16 (insulinase) family peptidase
MNHFKLLQEVRIKEFDFIFKHFTHSSNAQIIYIQKPDSNNCFNLTLKTTPDSSSGVAHILEHTTLCGSKKFPVFLLVILILGTRSIF